MSFQTGKEIYTSYHFSCALFSFHHFVSDHFVYQKCPSWWIFTFRNQFFECLPNVAFPLNSVWLSVQSSLESQLTSPFCFDGIVFTMKSCYLGLRRGNRKDGFRFGFNLDVNFDWIESMVAISVVLSCTNLPKCSWTWKCIWEACPFAFPLCKVLEDNLYSLIK